MEITLVGINVLLGFGSGFLTGAVIGGSYTVWIELKHSRE